MAYTILLTLDELDPSKIFWTLKLM